VFNAPINNNGRARPSGRFNVGKFRGLLVSSTTSGLSQAEAA